MSELPRPKSLLPLPEHAEKVFSGVIFEVYQWEQELYDGTKATFEKLARADSTLVIPVTESGEILITRQQQPGKETFITCAGGVVDPGEDPLAAARRELLEETGYESQEMVLLEAFQPYAKIEWSIFVFIAKGCRKVAEQQLDGGEQIEVEAVSFADFLDLMSSDICHDLNLKMRILEAKADPAKLQELENILFR